LSEDAPTPPAHFEDGEPCGVRSGVEERDAPSVRRPDGEAVVGVAGETMQTTTGGVDHEDPGGDAREGDPSSVRREGRLVGGANAGRDLPKAGPGRRDPEEL
jgi:hypothetical protein